MRGRPPKPLETHQLDGTYRPDRHGAVTESPRIDGAPVMPETFTGEAKACWETVVEPLILARVAKAVDTPALVALCEWWARYRRLSAALDALDPAEDSQTFGRLHRLASDAWGSFERIAAQCGLTPAARSRIRVEGETKKQGVMSRPRG